MERTYLNGSGGTIMDHIAGTGLYEFVPSQESLNAIITAMRVNLELEDEEYDTSFGFSIDQPYEQRIIGDDLYGGVTYYERVTVSDDDDEEENKSDSTCNAAENRELGADMKTCVCKYGYKEDASCKCVKKTVTCPAGETLDKNDNCIPDDDDTTATVTCTNGTVEGGACTCWAGYSGPDADGYCTKDETEPETPKEPEDFNVFEIGEKVRFKAVAWTLFSNDIHEVPIRWMKNGEVFIVVDRVVYDDHAKYCITFDGEDENTKYILTTKGQKLYFERIT
jgi:hypothetical protein